MFTLAPEFINGEAYDGSASTLEAATAELLASGITLHTVIYNPRSSTLLYQHYTVTVEGVFNSGTQDLMTHYLEIF